MNLGDYSKQFTPIEQGAGAGTEPAPLALADSISQEMLSSLGALRHAPADIPQEPKRPPSGAFYRSEVDWPRRMTFVSSDIEAITGYDPDFFLTTSYSTIIKPEDVPSLQAVLEQAVVRGEDYSTHYRIRHRNGETRWVGEHGKAIPGHDGRSRHLEGFITEVTGTKARARDAAAACAEGKGADSRLRRILESSPDCVISVDRNWQYTYFNKRAWQERAANRFVISTDSMDTVPNIQQSPFWPALCNAMNLRQVSQAQGFVPEIGKWYDLHIVPDEDGITVFFRDITRYKELEKTLEDKADDLRKTLDSIPHIIWSTRSDGAPDYFNKVWYEYVGTQVDTHSSTLEILNSELFHPDERDSIGAKWQSSVEAGKPFEFEFRLRHKSGEYRWLVGCAWPQFDDKGAISGWYGSSTDVHERILAERNLRESEILQSNILGASIDCIKVMNFDGTLMQISDPGMRAMEIEDRADVIGSSWLDFWPQEGKAAARRAIRTARRGETARFSGFCPTAKGKPRWWDNILTPIRNDRGQVRQILCVSRNITEQRRTSDRLRKASECDAMTALPNRRAFEAHLNKAAVRARETGKCVGLMLLDLDHFKDVNDTLGHLAGDHLLRVIARRLKAFNSATEFVARLGGDEFAIVIEGVADEAALLHMARQIHARLATFVIYGGQPINGGLSIGCALFPRDANDARNLFKHADTALYDLKAGGRGGVQMFSRRMVEEAERHAAQLNLARRIIHEDVLEPYYQPKVRLDTGDMVGLEALLRWWSPANGIQPPTSIAEAFNDYELAAKIGDRMQDRVLADIAQWLAAGLSPVPVSINAAPAEFLRDNYAEHLLRRLEKHEVPTALVEVEITEHAFLARRSEQVVRALHVLKGAGIRIALDDFGTGQSSLSHLQDFPVDVLKLDRSFIARMIDEPAMMAIVTAMAKLGPSLSLDIIAEGIETPEQLRALQDAGCGFGQGYLFGEGVPSGKIADLLKRRISMPLARSA